MICPNCGFDTPGKFCPNCGARLIQNKPAENAEAPAAPIEAPAVPVEAPAVPVEAPAGQAEAPAEAIGQPVPPEPAAAPEAEEAVKQAELAAAAAAAVLSGETVQLDPSLNYFAPGRGAAPEQPAPASGPVQAAPNQGFDPSRTAPNQGFDPSRTAPNQGYAPNPPMGGPNFRPYPNQAPNPAFVPTQGYNPGVRNAGPYGAAPADAPGKSPASQLLRRLGGSGAFLLGAVLMTLAFLLSSWLNGKSVLNAIQYLRIPAYERAGVIATVSSYAAVMLVHLLIVIALWAIVRAAANQKRLRMGTGGLTVFRVLAILGLIGGLLLFIGAGALLAIYLTSGGYPQLSSQLLGLVHSTLQQNGLDLAKLLHLSQKSLVTVLFGVLLLADLLAVIFCAGLIKTLNTAKRVAKTGVPDDRVSVFVAVLALLVFAGTLISAVGYFLVAKGLEPILMGCSAALSALATLFFAVVLFKYRSGMRNLGVCKGVLSRPM